ncbi:exonuclease [Synechococcus phage S-SCSM1]|uniref:Endonuclease n=1 Tax=Synechococcus phage S-SCSM1 TaxID=2588487 RepID=A0A6M2ZHZ3_9CAUD|nr:exonuclease [Synechococcus phage S-SCSM1]QFG06309.1 endonuclease [Synechococcus phage S-SCSM1]
MIYFKKISWKNFLSTGNQFTEVQLDECQNSLIIGTNGAGKSTILDALTFVLFGKSFRKINKPQLINSTNEKDCVVNIDFRIGSVEWSIVRGIKPNIFEIYRDGTLLDQAASANDQQKYLEQSILKMNYKSFTQIVILGSSNFTPFMQLPASGRREVIEDILDIKVFSTMNNIIKDQLRKHREDIKVLNLKKESVSDKVLMQENFIKELDTRGKNTLQKYEDKISELNIDIDVFNQNNKIEEKEILRYRKELESVQDAKTKIRTLGNLKGKISQKMDSIKREQNFFSDNLTCPTCEQTIEESFRTQRLKNSNTKLKELEDGFEQLIDTIKSEEFRESVYDNITKSIMESQSKISTNSAKISSLQAQITGLNHEIKTLNDQSTNKNEEKEKLNAYKESLEKVFDDLTEKRIKVSNHDFLHELLKDSGVKSKIIEKYLPLINQQVSKYLQMMEFYINFKLDEEFNETVESPIHEDFSYSSFSEGEKQRIDLALLFTWREVAKIKNSTSTNLLIMDEIFDSSLDGFGTDDFLKIIRFVVKDANVFVISHKESLHDKFDRVIKFEKRKNFSQIVES